jgi:hypothetical protein
MPELRQLTSAYWKRYKQRSEIESKPWFGSDASVGSAITKLNSRRASWARAKTDLNLLGYFRALENLKKQMGKFLATKEFKTDIAQQFYNEIVKWRREIDTKLNQLAIKYDAERPNLAQANADELGKTFDTFVL